MRQDKSAESTRKTGSRTSLKRFFQNFTDKEDQCISEKISKLVDEGKPRDQAVAIAISDCASEKSENSTRASSTRLQENRASACTAETAFQATDSSSEENSLKTVILEKELLKSGRFFDMNNIETIIEPEDVRRIIDNTEKLRETGFRINSFPDHFEISSMEILGQWLKFFVVETQDGPHAFGLLELMPGLSEEEVERIMKLDVSVVTDEFHDGETDHGEVILRADIVGQGAIPGLDRFKKTEKARAFSIPGLQRFKRLGAEMPEDREEQKVAEDREDKSREMQEMPEGMDQLLDKAREIWELEGASDEAVLEALMEKMKPHKEEERGMSSGPGSDVDESKVTESPDQPEPEDAVAMGANKQLSLRVKELEKYKSELEREQLENIIETRQRSLTAPVDAHRINAIRRGYEKMRRAFGHKESLEIATERLDDLTTGVEKLSQKGTPVPRRKLSSRGGSGKNPLVEQAKKMKWNQKVQKG